MKRFTFLSIFFAIFASACASSPETPPVLPVTTPVIQAPSNGSNLPAPPSEPTPPSVFGSWRLTSVVCDGEGDPLLIARTIERFTNQTGETIIWSIQQEEESAMIFNYRQETNLRRIYRTQAFHLEDGNQLVRRNTSPDVEHDDNFPGISLPRNLAIWHMVFPRHNPVRYTYVVSDRTLTLTQPDSPICTNTDDEGNRIPDSPPRNQVMTFEREI